MALQVCTNSTHDEGPFPQATGPRLPVLDGIRGVAILLVVLTHVSQYSWSGVRNSFDRAVYLVTMAGWCGVDLFFVLSGFLITGILVDTKEERGYFQTFYTRRILRIFPLYYGWLLVMFVLLPLLPEWSTRVAPARGEQIWYWSYLSNVLIAFRGWPSDEPRLMGLAHFWSLAVEEQFYCVWPLVIYLCSRKQLLAICAAVVPVSLAVRVALVVTGRSDAAYALMPARMDALAIGALLAMLARDRRAAAVAVEWAGHVILVSAALIASIVWVQGDFFSSGALTQTFGYTALAGLFAGWLWLTLASGHGTLLHRVATNRALRFFGEISYGLYVFHHPIIGLLRHWDITVAAVPRLFGSALPGYAAMVLLVGVSSSFAALLSQRFIERPLLQLKHRFPYRRRPARRAVVATTDVLQQTDTVSV